MEQDKIKISLCDLANDLNGIDNKSIPLGIGFIASYCRKIHSDSVNVKIYRTFKTFWNDSVNHFPDVVGFGSYDWNFNLTMKTIEKIKKINPDCLIVIGGANAEIHMPDNYTFLKNNPNVDYIVYGDGERPFSNIISEYKKVKNTKNWLNKLKKVPIDGCRTLLKDKLIFGKPFDAVMELDEIPSPYLNGLFDELLLDSTLMPIIQNIRGCPYKCRYCVSGTQFGKIRHFSFERLKDEITYLRNNAKNRFLRFSDDNFGIVKHDLEVAKYVRNCFDLHNYPAGIKVYSAKKQTALVREVGKILKPLMTYCVSFQTTTKAVLKETIRVSAKHHEAVESLEFARNNGLSTATELIFGLPGESLESWKDVINTTMSYGFDSISMNPLWLLKGSDLNRSESREENKYVGKFMLAENAVTAYDDFISIERDEIAVASKHYTFEEWKVFLKYQIQVLMLNYFGYGKELIYYANNMDIKPIDLFDYILNNPKKFPITQELTETYVKTYTSNMFDTEQELYDFISKNLQKFKNDKESLIRLGKARGLYSYIVKYMLRDPQKLYLSELKQAVIDLNPEKHVKEEVNFLFDLSLNLMIDPFKKFIPDLEMTSQYDVYSWVRDGYNKKLGFYKRKEILTLQLKCRNSITVSETIKKDREHKRTDCFHFFRYMNSGLMRRYIHNDNINIDNSSPWEPFRREHRTVDIQPG